MLPILEGNSFQILFSWILFLSLGLVGNFFASLNAGNIFAIYSEVCVPETRSTINAFNGTMVNIGAIIGNLLLSTLIKQDLGFLPLAIFLVLVIWMLGSLFWLVPLKYYSIDVSRCNELKMLRRSELEGNV